MALTGKVAIITGSSSGIGAGIAEVFAKEGAKVSLTGRNKKNLEEVAKKLKTDVLINVGDITNGAFRKTLVEATKKKFGKIDILVNNAGVSGMSPLNAVTKEHYDHMMSVNLEAPVFLTQLVLPYLIETKGCVVNTSTAGTSMTTPNAGCYAMSKEALDTYTRHLALEMASKGVRVNAVNPGYVPSSLMAGQLSKEVTAMMEKALINVTPIGRAGTPEEIGEVVAFLASEKAAFVTGVCVRADGGMTLSSPVPT